LALYAAAGGGTAQAAWNNVFQVCCHNCRSSVSHASPITCCPQPCPQPCPQQVCKTEYVQRSYYQPVVTYKQETYLEPVTTYRTSFYWEPVTSYRYSCYFDPCTCRTEQRATPVTSYRLRSQCCPVTSYLQRCCMKPVTTYQQVCYFEPVTTCCTTTIGAPVTTLPPGVQEQRPGVTMPPGVREENTGSGSESFKSNNNSSNAPYMPPAKEGSSSRQPQLQAPVTPPATPPKVRLERIASLSEPTAEGKVVSLERAVPPGARLMFVSTEVQGQQQTATADDAGQVRVMLASGGWLVYLLDKNGKADYQQRLEVKDGEATLLTFTKK
jgi:hypothetical protein